MSTDDKTQKCKIKFYRGNEIVGAGHFRSPTYCV